MLSSTGVRTPALMNDNFLHAICREVSNHMYQRVFAIYTLLLLSPLPTIDPDKPDKI